MCSVRAESREGRMPRASAASEAMWLWKLVRSGMTEPTTRPSRSAGRTPGTESKQAFPASHTRSRYVAFRPPTRAIPAPTSATRRITLPSPSRPGLRSARASRMPSSVASVYRLPGDGDEPSGVLVVGPPVEGPVESHLRESRLDKEGSQLLSGVDGDGERQRPRPAVPDGDPLGPDPGPVVQDLGPLDEAGAVGQHPGPGRLEVPRQRLLP